MVLIDMAYSIYFFMLGLVRNHDHVTCEMEEVMVVGMIIWRGKLYRIVNCLSAVIPYLIWAQFQEFREFGNKTGRPK